MSRRSAPGADTPVACPLFALTAASGKPDRNGAGGRPDKKKRLFAAEFGGKPLPLAHDVSARYGVARARTATTTRAAPAPRRVRAASLAVLPVVRTSATSKTLWPAYPGPGPAGQSSGKCGRRHARCWEAL